MGFWKFCCYCCTRNVKIPFRKIRETTNLTDQQWLLVENRYLNQVQTFNDKYRQAATVNWILRFIRVVLVLGVLCLSALIPAISSHMPSMMEYSLICFSAVLSVIVGIQEAFGLSWKHSVYWFVKNRLVSEGWQLMSLCGRYRGGQGQSEEFVRFMGHVEDISADAINAIGQSISSSKDLTIADGKSTTKDGSGLPTNRRDLSHTMSIRQLEIPNISGVQRAAEATSEVLPEYKVDDEGDEDQI